MSLSQRHGTTKLHSSNPSKKTYKNTNKEHRTWVDGALRLLPGSQGSLSFDKERGDTRREEGRKSISHSVLWRTQCEIIKNTSISTKPK